MNFKLIYLISLILCVFLTFSTVNAIDLNENLSGNLNSSLNVSQSESLKLNSMNEYNVVENIEADSGYDVVPGIGLSNYDNSESISSSGDSGSSDSFTSSDSKSDLEYDGDCSVVDDESAGGEIVDDSLAGDDSLDLSGVEDLDLCVNDSNGTESLENSSLSLSATNGLLASSDGDSTALDSSSESNGLSDSQSDLLSNSINSNGGALQSGVKVGGNTFDDIRKAIANANAGDTIYLNGKTFVGNGTQITINKPLNIAGGSANSKATLDASNASCIFVIGENASSVNISNCNFLNGYGIAVIIKSDNCSISDCTFADNYAYWYCSHLRVDNGTENFLLQRTNFVNGFSKYGTNVAVYANNSIVRDCLFYNNTIRNDEGLSGYGGALQIGSDPEGYNVGYIYNCSFVNNSIDNSGVVTHGGALCFRPGIKVYNSTFINNSCNGVGGATTLHADGEIFNCIFINNTAGVFGGAVTTGLETDDISVNITDCYFENNTAPMGGAIQIKGNDVKVTDTVFYDNKATETNGGALFIQGNRALIVDSVFDSNYADNIGAAVLINGSDVSVLNSSFNSNIADFGAAIFINGVNANISGSNFTKHNVRNGTVYIKGSNAFIKSSNFNHNLGENGAAIFIEGSDAELISNNITYNNVTKNGGSIYILGSNTILDNDEFSYNNAVPNLSDIGSGLGGAVYIKGNNNLIQNSDFRYNTARNGSAIYTDGVNMTLNRTDFDLNQAWSYNLSNKATPKTSYYGKSDVLINITHIGGNNIANAIYNTASVKDIHFYNVSYVSSKGARLTGINEISPVVGAENSRNGTLLYQDDREDNQLVEVVVKQNSDNKTVFNKTFNTGILGNISFILNDFVNGNLSVSNYSVYANHFEDPYYKAIESVSNFEILPLVDIAVDISSKEDVTEFNRTITYIINVTNYGPNNASGVVVDNMLPDGLIINSTDPSKGSYNYTNHTWDVGNLDSGENQTLVVVIVTNTTGLVDYPVNVTSNENDTDKSNNYANKSIYVNSADLAIEVISSEDTVYINDTVDWTFYVVNNGPDNGENVSVSISDLERSGLIVLNYTIVNSSGDVVYSSFGNSSYGNSTGDNVFYSDSNPYYNNTWFIGNLKSGDDIALFISTKVNDSNVNITSVAVVDSSTYDTNKSNNKDNDTVEVLSLCDLAISIVPSSEIVDFKENASGIINWTIHVVNNGPDSGENVNVSISDLEDSGLVILNSSVVDSSKGYFDNETNSWHIGNLDYGDDATLVISTLADVYDTNITVLASVNTSTLESDLTNNYDNATVEVLPVCDMAISITPNKESINLTNTDLDIINWTITIVNNGPNDAENVSVLINDFEDMSLEVIDYHTDSNTSFDKNSNIWNIGDFDVGDNMSLVVSTLPKVSNTNITLSSIVNSSTYDSDLTNNHDKSTVEILPVCDVSISILPNPDIVNSTGNDSIDWTIVVSNNGPDNASNVTMNLNDLEDIGLIIRNISNSSYDTNTNSLNIGDLSSGSNVTLIITTNPNMSNINVTGLANVTTSTYDSNRSNNYDNATVEILPLCDLTVTVVPNKETVNLTGDDESNINWTITVTNNGPDNADDVFILISDLNDLNLTYLSSSSDSYDEYTNTWSIGTLNNGDSRTLTLSTRPYLSNTNITLNATANTGTYDTNLSNNFDNATISTLPLTDVAITITADKSIVNLTNEDDDESIVTWTITVTNNGPDNATGVTAYDILPEDLELISYDLTKGSLNVSSPSSDETSDNSQDTSTSDDLNDSYSSDNDSESDYSAYGGSDSSTLNWNIGDLATGESTTLVLTTKSSNPGTTIQNVNVTSETYDSNLSNNNDSQDLLVIDDPLSDDNNNDNDNDDNNNSNSNSTNNNSNKPSNPNNTPETSNNPNPKHNTPTKDNHKTTKQATPTNSDTANVNMKNTGNPLFICFLSLLSLILINKRLNKNN